MNIKLVSDWRRAHKWRSVQFSTAGAVFSAVSASAVHAAAGSALFGFLSFRATLWIVCGIFVTSLVGRLIAQGGDE